LGLCKVSSYLFYTAELNAAAVKNLVSSGEVHLHLLSTLLDLGDVLAHLLLVDGIVGFLLPLHAFSSINRSVQLDRTFLVLAQALNLISKSIHV
jgi:hypothetical protein